jgi:hypothetical protein
MILREYDVIDGQRRSAMTKQRKPRSDMKVGTFEKKMGLKPGTIKTDTGRDKRSDAKIGKLKDKR